MLGNNKAIEYNKSMTEQTLRHSQRVVNVFGAVGYSLIIFLYVFLVLLGLLWVLSMGHMDFMGISLDPPDQPQVQSEENSQQPSGVATVLAYLLTGFMVVTAMFVFVSLPYWLGKIGSKWLKRLIRLCQIPVTLTSLLIGKLIACGLAVVPSSIFVINDIGAIYMAITVLTVSTLSAVVFVVQHSIAGMSRLEAKNVW